MMGYTLPNLTPESKINFSYTNTSSNSYLLAQNFSSTQSNGMKTISQGRYIGGGVASVFLGFGIGQAVQGRWGEKGWIHASVQGGLLLGYIGAFAFTVSSTTGNLETGNVPSGIIGGGLTMIGLGIAILGARVWEMVDTWILPDSIKITTSLEQINTSSLYSIKYKTVPSIGLQWKF